MTNLLMIGCGNMGGALLKGWVASGLPYSHIDVVKPSPPSADLQLAGVAFHTSLQDIPHAPDLVVWGVKPHQLEAVVPESVAAFGLEPVYISIAAGKTLANLQAYAGDAKIIRSMPNTPVAIGEGITGMCATNNVSKVEQDVVQELFATVGETIWVKEPQMNVLTALCGSGPAYVYYFMECLAAAGAELGLAADQADRLARHMVRGAASLATQNDAPLQTLRENVTSKGGTTAAALAVWMQKNTLDQQSKQALKAAVARAVELES